MAALDKLFWAACGALLRALRLLAPVCRQPDTIVVLRNCFFGDFVVVIPALRRLRAAFPQAHIVFLTASSFAPGWRDRPQDDSIFQLEPGLIDRVVRYTSHDLKTAAARAQLRGLLNAQGRVATLALGYSADALLSRLKRVVLCRLLGLPFPSGLTGTPTLLSQKALNRWRLQRTDIVHQRDAACASVDELLHDLGRAVPPAGPAPHRRPSHDDAGAPRRRVVGLAPFTKQPVKQWPLERFAQLADALASSFDVRFEIYGAPGEREMAAQLDALLAPGGHQVASLCGELTPQALREHIESLDLLIALDSGPMHVASLVDTPVVAVFSQITLHDFWRPWGRQGSIVSIPVPCAACDTRDGECPLGTRACIVGVPVDAVAQRARTTLLAASPP